MLKQRLIVDSSCDLPNHFYQELNIGVTDLVINFGERSYLDRKEITPAQILKIYKEEHILPKTSALNIADLTTVFEEELKEYDHIYYMPIASGISSIYNNARLASQAFEGKVTVLDSTSLSCGTGLLAIGIARDIQADLTPDEIVNNHIERTKRNSMCFVFANMELLYKGGRCSGLTYLLGTKFHIHPIIRLENCKMGVYKVTRGKDNLKGVDVMCNELIENLEKGNIDLNYPILLPNVLSPEGVKRAKANLEKYVGDKIIFPVDASGIICCHCGEDTLGISYMTKDPIPKK